MTGNRETGFATGAADASACMRIHFENEGIALELEALCNARMKLADDADLMLVTQYRCCLAGLQRGMLERTKRDVGCVSGKFEELRRGPP